MIKIYFFSMLLFSQFWSMEFFLFSMSTVWLVMVFTEQELIKLTMMLMNLFLMTLMIYLFTNMKLILFMTYLSMSIIFYSNNLFEMFIFFEFSLIPLIFLINGYGDSYKRLSASWMMFFYTFISSIPFFISILYIKKMNQMMMMETYSLFWKWMPIMMILVLMVKTPIFLFHYWLPKAHVESPYWGSMILAGLILKIGGFMFMKTSKMILFSSTMELLFWMTILSALITSIYCLLEVDQKILIAYSSISHMSMMMTSFIMYSNLTMIAMLLFMVSHAFTSSSMFYGLNNMYECLKTKSFLFLKGTMNMSSVYMYMYFIILCTNFGMPPFMSFFSEIMTLYLALMKLNNLFLIFMSIMMVISIFNMNFFINLSFGFPKMKSLFNMKMKDLTLTASLLVANLYMYMILIPLF